MSGLNLVKYSNETEEEPTAMQLSPYLAQEEPTFEWQLTREEAMWEAGEISRLGSHEAEGFWLLMSQGLPQE
jgi:hypothetical protein